MSKRAVKPRINLPLTSASTAVASTGGGGAAAPSPTTVSLATGNTVAGGLHTHELDIAAHTGDASAHHNPVTVGNTGLSLSTQQLSLNLATTSGLQIDAGLKIADTIAGNGLTISGKVLAVGAGAGLTVSADAIALTMPGTLTVATANAASGNHTHAITSSSNPGATARILASDASGYLQLRRIGLGTAPSYPLHVSAATQQARFDYNTSNYLSITVGSDGSARLSTATGASGGNLTLAPAGDVVFDPTGNDLLPLTGYDLNIGSLQKKYLTLHCAELWVETLVAHETLATIGGRILVGPTTELTADVSNSQSTFSLKHNEPDDGDVLLMEADGKVEFLRVVGRDIVTGNQTTDVFGITGNLTAYFTAGVTFVIRGSTGNDGTYTTTGSGYIAAVNRTEIGVSEEIPSGTWDGYIAYRGSGPYLYWMERDLDGSGGNEWPAGSALFNTGATGDGFIDLYSVHGVHAPSAYGPSIVGNVRNSTTFNDWSEHWAIGNLSGLYGYGSTAYGFAAGKYANGASFITVDATNGVRMLSRSGGVDTTRAQWAVDGTLTIGEVAAERSNIQISAGALAVRLNTTNLIAADASGNLALGQVATDQGNAYWNATNKRLEFRGGTDGTVVQAYVDTSGAFVAGDGRTWLDAMGMNLRADEYLSGTWIPTNGTRIRWLAPTGTNLAARIASQQHTTTSKRMLQLWAGWDAYDPATLELSGDAIAGSARANIDAALTVARDTLIEGGLNVGTATGAAAGDIRASGTLWLGPTGARMNMNYLVLDDDETDNILSAGGAAHGLFAILNATTGSLGLFSRSVNTVTIISDPSGVWRNTDTDGFSCVYVSGANLVLRNRSGSTVGYRIHHFG